MVTIDVASVALVLAVLRPAPPVAAAAVALWPVLLMLANGYDRALLGGGWAEFRRVLLAGAWALSLAAVGSTALGIPVGTNTALLVPATVTVSLLGRLMLRRVVQREWTAGVGTNRVLIVGEARAAASVADGSTSIPASGSMSSAHVRPKRRLRRAAWG